MGNNEIPLRLLKKTSSHHVTKCISVSEDYVLEDGTIDDLLVREKCYLKVENHTFESNSITIIGKELLNHTSRLLGTNNLNLNIACSR